MPTKEEVKAWWAEHKAEQRRWRNRLPREVIPIAEVKQHGNSGVPLGRPRFQGSPGRNRLKRAARRQRCVEAA